MSHVLSHMTTHVLITWLHVGVTREEERQRSGDGVTGDPGLVLHVQLVAALVVPPLQQEEECRNFRGKLRPKAFVTQSVFYVSLDATCCV